MKKFIFIFLTCSLAASAGAQQMDLLKTSLPEEGGKKAVDVRKDMSEDGPVTEIRPVPPARKAARPVTGNKLSPSEYASRYLHPGDRIVEPKEKSPIGGFTVLKRHMIEKGDTLWDLSQKYYGDPFMWGRIYNANFSSVANPDLIYPKGELIIPDITEVLIPYRTPEVAETEISTEEWAAEEEPYGDYVSAEAVPASEVKPSGLSEMLPPFDRNTLSEEMPEDQKEWADGIQIAPDSWKEDGVVTAKAQEEDEFLAEALSITGGLLDIKMERSGMVRPGDYLDIYLRGSESYDKSGKRLGHEIQLVGMAEVSSVDGSVVKARVINSSTGIFKGYLVKKK